MVVMTAGLTAVLAWDLERVMNCRRIAKAIGLHAKNATGMDQNEQSVLLAMVKGRSIEKTFKFNQAETGK